MNVKNFLDKVLEETLEPIRARRREYEKDIPGVYDILRSGTEVAREEAAKTLAEVKDAMRINYFSDEELIRAQTETYAAIAEN